MLNPIDWIHKLTESAKNISDLLERGGDFVDRARLERAVRALRTLYFFDDGVVQELRSIAFADGRRPVLNARRLEDFERAEQRVVGALTALRDVERGSVDLVNTELMQTLVFISTGKMNVRSQIRSFIRRVTRTGKAEQLVAAELLAEIAKLNEAISTVELIFLDRFGDFRPTPE